jgi:hypothetical protein
MRAVRTKESAAIGVIKILLFKYLGLKKILDGVKEQETRCLVF